MTKRFKFGVVCAALSMSAVSETAQAQTQPYAEEKARRQWITVSYDWMYTYPLHFDNHPLEDLLGTKVDESDPPYDYQTRDGSTLVDVVEFKNRGRAVGATIYPLGMSVGPTLGIRGSIETVPDIHLRFEGPGRPFDSYDLTNAKSYDIGIGLFVADRAPGWGLGSYAFIVGGIGRITGDERNGRRMFAEGGGGIQSGPLGVEIAAKFGWNRFSEPVEHRFLTIPITLRGTVSF